MRLAPAIGALGALMLFAPGYAAGAESWVRAVVDSDWFPYVFFPATILIIVAGMAVLLYMRMREQEKEFKAEQEVRDAEFDARRRCEELQRELAAVKDLLEREGKSD